MAIPRIAVFASGAGSNAAELIRHFRQNPCAEIALVVSNKRSAGALTIAEQAGIPSLWIAASSFHDGEPVLDVMRNYRIQWIVLAGFLLRMPDNLIAAFPDRILNIHPSLLPRYGGKGMYGHYVHEAVHAAGESESGITIHFVNENYDEGQILFQARVPISTDDDAAAIELKVRMLEKEHFAPIVQSLICREHEREANQ